MSYTPAHMETFRQANKLMGLTTASVFVAKRDREKITLYAEQLRVQHYKAMYAESKYLSAAAQALIKKRPPALVANDTLVSLARIAKS